MRSNPFSRLVSSALLTFFFFCSLEGISSLMGILIFGTPHEMVQAAGGPNLNSDWWEKVQKHIRESEYHVTWQSKTYLPDIPAAYQAPNRVQNLRTYFTPEGPRVIPRVYPQGTNGYPWRWEMKLSGWGRGKHRQVIYPAVFRVEDNRLEYRRGQVVEWYRNDEKGLEQGFTLLAPPSQEVPGSPIQIALQMGGDLTPEMIPGENGIEFRDRRGVAVLRYDKLATLDAAGRSLPSRMALEGRELVIEVDDASALYPITIDPTLTGLSTDADWFSESNQTDASLGHSVATAGYVNGDEYADVIVGAPFYDSGHLDEGKVFVFYGSASGLNPAPGWQRESNQAGAKFGFSVATAGDVNGDGFSDVIIGAPGWTHNGSYPQEGGIWVYQGSPTGLLSYYSFYKTSSQADAWFGFSVATAGDVNGDGFSDVIVGAPQWHDPGGSRDQEGSAWVYRGSSSGLVSTPYWYKYGNQAGAQFGYSVATAGSVNGDGRSDIIVGAPFFTGDFTEEGAAWVYLGESTGISSSASWSRGGNQAHAHFGWSVSTAGDVNGDNYADVIVGAPDWDDGQIGEGGVWVFRGWPGGGLSQINYDQGNQENAAFGYSVGTAGDVNGDGYADIIVGAPRYSNGEEYEGRVWVWHGSASGVISSHNWRAEGNQTGAFFGQSVATAGDVNGDGYADVIIGAPWFSNGQNHEGRAWVYHGSAGSLSETAAWVKESNSVRSQFGFSVASAGDVNADGFADVIIGAPYYDGGQNEEGRVFLYLGSGFGLSALSDWNKESDKALARFGWSVASAGDVNNDGYGDVIIGAPGWTHNGTYPSEGGIFVYYGYSTVHGLPPSSSFYKTSGQANARFGYSVASAGDVNGDGYSDVIVGAPDWNRTGPYAGEGGAWVYRGSKAGLVSVPYWHKTGGQNGALYGFSVASAGDVNGDGFSDVIVGAPYYSSLEFWDGLAFVYHGSMGGLRSAPSWTGQVNRAFAGFGWSVASAGDVNNDGYADVIVGAPNYSNGQDFEGGSWVYLGASTGVNSAPVIHDEGNQAGANFGYSVASAGDVNGDGHADVIVGAPGYTNGESNEGKVWVWHGTPTGISFLNDWTVESNKAGAFFGHSVASAGDVNGDGYADVIIGAPRYENGQVEEGAAYFYYGNGGPGWPLTPRQLTDGGTLAPLGCSNSRTSFGSQVKSQTPFGGGKVTPQWEVNPLGVNFDLPSFVHEWEDRWFDTGVTISYTISGLRAGTVYHWRMRLKYQLAGTPFQKYSRWFTVPWNGWNEADFRTPFYPLYLPLLLKM